MQEASGKPVMALRDKGGVYDPQLPAGAAGLWIRWAVDQMEPRITDTRLSFWVRNTRRGAVKPNAPVVRGMVIGG